MEKEEILKQGRYVLNLEADALKSVAESLGDSFVEAVNLMYNTKGPCFKISSFSII